MAVEVRCCVMLLNRDQGSLGQKHQHQNRDEKEAGVVAVINIFVRSPLQYSSVCLGHDLDLPVHPERKCALERTLTPNLPLRVPADEGACDVLRSRRAAFLLPPLAVLRIDVLMARILKNVQSKKTGNARYFRRCRQESNT